MRKEAGKLYKDGKIDVETYQDMKKEGKTNVIKGTKQLVQLALSLFILGM
jgi:ribosomal protein L19E